MSEVHKWIFPGPICANMIEGPVSVNCQQNARLTCTRCHLVKYCSSDCQKKNWPLHKVSCRSPLTKAQWIPTWEKEKRVPRELDMATTFMAGPLKFLFGNMPAIDILKNTNRASNTKHDLHLCFASKPTYLKSVQELVDKNIACGDIRNVVETILNIPITFQQRVRVALNDFDEIVASRCVMLLISALSDTPEKAAEKMLHLWYSAFLPEKLLSDVLSDFKNAPDRKSIHARLKKFTMMQWNNKKTQSIITAVKIMEELDQHLKTPRALSKCELARKERVLSPDVFDDMETNMFAMDVFRRVSYMRYVDTGVVLSISASTKSFTQPNPLLFSPTNSFYLNVAANPAHGWSAKEIASFASTKDLPKNDVFGSLHTFILAKLVRFCEHIRQMDIDFIVTQEDCADLPRVLKTCAKVGFPQKFDTIEISNICDTGYMGTKVLDVLSPLLKSATLSFAPAIIGLHITAIDNALDWEDPSVHWKRKEPAFDRILEVLGFSKDRLESGTAKHMLVISALHLYIQIEDLFEIYRKKQGFEEAENKNRLRVRENKVVGMWPNRLKRGTIEDEKRQIMDISAEGTKGWERYVEWVKEEEEFSMLEEDID